MDRRPMFLDDLAKVLGGAASALGAVAGELRETATQARGRVLDRLDLVPRDDFEAVREMAARARLEQERLSERVAALEKALAEAARPASPARPTPARRRGAATAARRPATKRAPAKRPDQPPESDG